MKTTTALRRSRKQIIGFDMYTVLISLSLKMPNFMCCGGNK